METLTLFSSIKKELLQQQLMRGSAIAAVGACILIFGGTWVPQATLAFWGAPLFVAGIGFITLGMLPYRRLKLLEEHPYVIKIEGGMIYCFKGGKEISRIDTKTIESVEFVDDPSRYGIRFHLTSPKKGVFFLPYFSKNSFASIKAVIAS